MSSVGNVPPQRDLIVLGDLHRVFAIDALASSHPLSSKEEDIKTPAQISELFDAISYSKVSSWLQWGGPDLDQNPRSVCKRWLLPHLQGASVLRMLSDFLTEEVFTQGLTVRSSLWLFGKRTRVVCVFWVWALVVLLNPLELPEHLQLQQCYLPGPMGPPANGIFFYCIVLNQLLIPTFTLKNLIMAFFSSCAAGCWQ